MSETDIERVIRWTQQQYALTPLFSFQKPLPLCHNCCIKSQSFTFHTVLSTYEKIDLAPQLPLWPHLLLLLLPLFCSSHIGPLLSFLCTVMFLPQGLSTCYFLVEMLFPQFLTCFRSLLKYLSKRPFLTTCLK